MIESYTNDQGKPCYRGVELDTPLKELEFHAPNKQFEDDHQQCIHTNLGSITVLDRMTGFGWRDTETGYRAVGGKFWLASGGVDVMSANCTTVGDAIEFIKSRANTCNPDRAD